MAQFAAWSPLQHTGPGWSQGQGNHLPPHHHHTHHSPHRSPYSGALQITNLAGLSIIWRLEACVESWSLVSRVSTVPGPSITVVLVTLQRPLLLLPGSSHYSLKCLPQVSTSSHIKHSTIQTSLCIYSTVFVCLPVLPLWRCC